MIVFDLQCLDGGESFEAWFSSNAEFRRSRSERGLVQCPMCRIDRGREGSDGAARGRSDGTPARLKDAIAALAVAPGRAAAAIPNGSGTDFAETARAMHLGEIEPQPVHGQATRDEARSLVDEGVSDRAACRLPVVPPNQVN